MKKFYIGLIAFILSIYAIGIVSFSLLTYPNTRVNDQDRSLISRKEVFEGKIDNELVNFKGRETDSIKLAPGYIDFKSQLLGNPKLNQNPFLWPIQIFDKHDYKVEYKSQYDEAKLEDLIKNSSFDKKRKESKDAYIDEDKMEIVEEEVGNTYDLEKLKNEIITAFENKVKGEYKIENAYDNPQITKDDKKLQENLNQLKNIFKRQIVFDILGSKISLTGKEFLDMFDKSGDSFILDSQKSHEYIRQLAIKYDTYNRERKFKASGIDEPITVKGGIYGWLMDVKKTNEEFIKLVEKNGEDFSLEPIYIYDALVKDLNDIGKDYVEIDISRQKIWLYKDGKMIKTDDIATGKLTVKGYETPVGVDKIWSRERDRTLTGLNEDKKSSYRSFVNYWMPIGYTGVGLHDASWRKEFGGDIYKQNGSKGCINLKHDTAKAIYDNYKVGTPVVVYESTTNNSPTEFERQEQIRNKEAKPASGQ